MTGEPYEKYEEEKEAQRKAIYSDGSSELEDEDDYKDDDDDFNVDDYLDRDLLKKNDETRILTLEEIMGIPKGNTGIDEPKTEQDVMRESRLKRFVEQPIVDKMRISRGSKMFPPPDRDWET